MAKAAAIRAAPHNLDNTMILNGLYIGKRHEGLDGRDFSKISPDRPASKRVTSGLFAHVLSPYAGVACKVGKNLASARPFLFELGTFSDKVKHSALSFTYENSVKKIREWSRVRRSTASGNHNRVILSPVLF